jgi:predicted RNA-binding protein with PIN domain
LTPAHPAHDHAGMETLPKLVILDGYNIIHRSPRLRPGPTRTLRESRAMLVNLVSWMMGANNVRFLIVFDGAEEAGPDEPSGRVQVRFSRPPEKADDVIRRIVEQKVGGDEDITVVTADIEVARHARAEGADVSLSDLFLASAFGDLGREESGAKGAEADESADKPIQLSKKELQEWAEIFTRRGSAPSKEEDAEPEN